jgi:DNA-binding GntR family transcriptional regulator
MADGKLMRASVVNDGSAFGGRQSTKKLHTWLRVAILRGELPADTRVSQVQLAKQLGVSRTPLREALRLLEHEGLIESEPNRRVRIVGFSMRDLDELYAMRIQLETLGVRLTVPHLSEKDLRGIEQKLQRMEAFAEAGEYENWQVPHRAFHCGLVAHAGERLIKTITQLSDHGERYRHYYTVGIPQAWSRSIIEHRAIFDAIRVRDSRSVTEKLARHYSTVALSLIAILAPQYNPVAVRAALRMVMANTAGSVEEEEDD